MRRSLEGVSYQDCPYCSGRGIVKSALTMSIAIIRQLEKRLTSERYKRVEVTVNSNLKEYLLNYKATLDLLSRKSRCNIVIVEEPYLHIEDFRINVK
jgi:Ribonuclease G/E